ncbi:hypothetical protein AA0111_g205 [Alternaria arborescens]|uniref:hypothetical protein n=1 Tax=Alternaria arborescens TaxID=156630 RepID=UPI001074D58A|nr:hypothetical protein AA0111_g205 [Alternaria arborescens]RYO43225.1 hypothetical protein AA0111_g205 [Alternaria arborescens]
MTPLQLFKILALFLLAALTTASPIAIPTTGDVSVPTTIPGDVSIAIPASTSDDVPNDVSTEVNCYRCVYINLFCKEIGLTEDQCFQLRCKDPDCYRCRSSCRANQQLNGSDSATAGSVVAESSSTSMAPVVKREEAKQCFWVCIHTYCTRQCIGDDAVAALRANSALVIDEADMKTNTTISVSSSHAQLKRPFLYHCDWTSGICWTDPVLQAVAGSEISIEEIPDIPTKVCREVCSTDESLCGMICDVDENEDKNMDVGKADVANRGLKCHWECMFGQCWAVCLPTMAVGSADADAVMGLSSLKCRWECYFGQCYACCVPSAKGEGAQKRGTLPPPCHERCDDDKCWIVCPRPPIE